MSEQKSIQEQLNELRIEFQAYLKKDAEYKNNGYWGRRDVLKSLGGGLLAIAGIGALADSAAADTTITGTGITTGTVTTTNPLAAIRNGTFVGTGTMNRDYPHSLGTDPKLIVITSDSANGYASFWVKGVSFNHGFSSGHGGYGDSWGVVSADATNFRVGVDSSGNFLNLSGVTYAYVVIG